jgi:hypothetical protein
MSPARRHPALLARFFGKRGCFVLEGKQSKKREQDLRTRELVQLGLELGEASFTRTGTGKRDGRGWDAVMAAAKQQADSYAKALPKEDGKPPVIIVVDVGHVIDVYADFSLQGKHYAQFPDREKSPAAFATGLWVSSFWELQKPPSNV